MKKKVILVVKLLLLVIAFPILYLVFAYVLSMLGTNPPALECTKEHQIYVSSNGVHIDLILPVSWLSIADQKALRVEEGIEYIAYGWGDKGFYLDTPTWAELKVSTALTAAFIKSPTVMHITRYKQREATWTAIDLCQSQLETIYTHIQSSFKHTPDQQIIEVEGAGYTEYDRFYQAIGYYSCLRTCNIWVNEALKKGQIKTSIWSPFDFGILHHLGE